MVTPEVPHAASPMLLSSSVENVRKSLEAHTYLRRSPDL